MNLVKKKRASRKALTKQLIKDPKTQEELLKILKVLRESITIKPKRGRPKEDQATARQLYLDVKLITEFVDKNIQEDLSIRAALIFLKVITLPIIMDNITNKDLKSELERVSSNIKSVKDIDNLHNKYKRGKKSYTER